MEHLHTQHTMTAPSESSFRDCDHLCHLNSKSFHWGNTSIWTVTSRTVTSGLFKNTKLIAVFSFCIKSLQGILKCYKIIHSCGVVLDRACSEYSRTCPCRTITVDMWGLIRGIWWRSVSEGVWDGNESLEPAAGAHFCQAFAWVCYCAEHSGLRLREGIVMNHAV